MMKQLFYALSTAAILLLSACINPKTIDFQRAYTNGKKVYQINCQNCHGAEGLGLAKLYPPLTDTSFLKIQRENLPYIIKYGLSKPIMVQKEIYHERMPANPQLSNQEIKEVITYITNSFGNKQGIYSDELLTDTVL